MTELNTKKCLDCSKDISQFKLWWPSKNAFLILCLRCYNTRLLVELDSIGGKCNANKN